MTPPLFVGEDFAYDFFASVDDAVRYIEDWFPDACPEYRAYDSAGRQLRLSVRSEQRGRFRRPVTQLVIEAVSDADAVERAAHYLRGFLASVGDDIPTDGLTYEQLLEMAVQRAGYTR